MRAAGPPWPPGRRRSGGCPADGLQGCPPQPSRPGRQNSGTLRGVAAAGLGEHSPLEADGAPGAPPAVTHPNRSRSLQGWGERRQGAAAGAGGGVAVQSPSCRADRDLSANRSDHGGSGTLQCSHRSAVMQLAPGTPRWRSSYNTIQLCGVRSLGVHVSCANSWRGAATELAVDAASM